MAIRAEDLIIDETKIADTEPAGVGIEGAEAQAMPVLERVFGVSGVVAEISVAGLADALDDLPPSELGDAVVAIGQLRNRWQALENEAVRRYDQSMEWSADGYRSPAAAIKDLTGTSKPAAARKVTVARKLEGMPHTLAAWRAGLIDLCHVDRLCKANQPKWAQRFREAEALLVDNAMRMHYVDFAKTVARFEELAGRDHTDDDDSGGHADRSMHLSPMLDGLGKLDATLDPVGHSIATRVLRRIERELFEADWAEAVDEHGEANVTIDKLRRTPTQRRHDALIEALRRAEAAPPGGRRPQPLVIVHMDFATFENELKRRVGAPFDAHDPEMLCELHDGTPIGPGEALALAIEGHVRRLVFDTPDEKTRFGREARLFTGPLRLMIEARDRHCAGPGCDVPSNECHIDHVVDWQHGGLTEGDNGEAKCGWHNGRKSQYLIWTDPVTGRARWRKRE